MDLDVKVATGQLVVVVGHTGCGKSSLLNAMLGMMSPVGGEAAVYGRVAYVPQQSFIYNATVRGNITFGGDWHANRYGGMLGAT